MSKREKEKAVEATKKVAEQPVDGNQFINAPNSNWNTLYVAGSLALFALFALCAARVV